GECKEVGEEHGGFVEVFGGGDKAVNQGVAFVRGGVGEKGSDISRRRDTPGDVQIDAADEFGVRGDWRGNHVVTRHPVKQDVVNEVFSGDVLGRNERDFGPFVNRADD